jgi:pilus assembly protein CpaB
MKQKLILVIAIVAGVVAFWLTGSYLKKQEAELESARQNMNRGIEMMYVIAVKNDLPAGTVIARKDLAEKEVRKRDVGNAAVVYNDVHLVLGKKLKFPLSVGDTLLWSMLDIPYAPGYGLAPAIKPGLRAVSVSIGGAASVSGLVQPNDHVDVLGTFEFPSRKKTNESETVTLTILQDVTVLATGQNMASQSTDRRTASTGYNTVTFEVTPREAELLIFAETVKGRLYLSLRNPEDGSFEPNLLDVNFDHIQSNLKEYNRYRQQTIRHKDMQP